MKTICPNCKKKYTLELMKDNSMAAHQKYRKWRDGALVQNVWPNATSIQREQLLTGLCSDKCWEAFLS